MSPAIQDMRPPRYPNEGPLRGRTAQNDLLALKMARLARHGLVDKRVKSATRRKSSKLTVESNASGISTDPGSIRRPHLENQDQATSLASAEIEKDLSAQAFGETRQQDMAEERSQENLYGDLPDFMLPLKSMYDGTGSWPKKKNLPFGAKQTSWANIGFPLDKSLIVPDIESLTHINHHDPSIILLSQDIIDIKSQTSETIADDGVVETAVEHGRTIETFRLHNLTVCRVKIADCTISNQSYASCKISKETEKAITTAIGTGPALNIVQWVAAHLLLAQGGQIGGRSQDYWKKARDLAQQQLYINPNLNDEVQQQMKISSEQDTAFTEMLAIVKECIKINTFNAYHQAKRDEYGVSNNIFYRVKNADVVMVIDQNNEPILFQLSDAFQKLLTSTVECDAVQALETYSTLHPVPLPDMTRHGLRYIEWLLEHPELDFRRPDNDPRLAKSGTYHFGTRCSLADPLGTEDPRATKDLRSKFPDVEGSTIEKQLMHLSYGALGACTEMVRHVFGLLDPGLLEDYTKVAEEVGKIRYFQPFQTRRQNEIFSLRAILVNVMTYEHRDVMDWHHGFAGLVLLGDYQGGDLLIRELGLQIESRPGCLQLLRGRELRHSITKWTGRRFVVVSTTHDAIKRWAFRRLGKPVSTTEEVTVAEVDDCLDVPLEDVLPEDQRVMSDREMNPERYVRYQREDEWSNEDSTSMSGSDYSVDSEDLKRMGNVVAESDNAEVGGAATHAARKIT
ncbi:hypothetical protein F4778DRAFT_436504 [Xylariomycetidae sp. FL2044]|nr:hypothetical protein F4778DRAFT_436504 [Xylariomycetidae sp. FL2044]